MQIAVSPIANEHHASMLWCLSVFTLTLHFHVESDWDLEDILNGKFDTTHAEPTMHIIKGVIIIRAGFPWWFSGKETACQCRRCRFNLWVRKIPRRRDWLPTPAFLPGKSHGQRSLVGYSPWGCKRAGHNLTTKQQQQNGFNDNETTSLEHD